MSLHDEHTDPRAGRPRKPGAVTRSCILALDLGTSTGWALRAHDGLITSGTVSFKPGRFDGGGMRYLRFSNRLTSPERELVRQLGEKLYGGLPAVREVRHELTGQWHACRTGSSWQPT